MCRGHVVGFEDDDVHVVAERDRRARPTALHRLGADVLREAVQVLAGVGIVPGRLEQVLVVDVQLEFGLVGAGPVGPGLIGDVHVDTAIELQVGHRGRPADHLLRVRVVVAAEGHEELVVGGHSERVLPESEPSGEPAASCTSIVADPSGNVTVTRSSRSLPISVVTGLMRNHAVSSAPSSWPFGKGAITS